MCLTWAFLIHTKTLSGAIKLPEKSQSEVRCFYCIIKSDKTTDELNELSCCLILTHFRLNKTFYSFEKIFITMKPLPAPSASSFQQKKSTIQARRSSSRFEFSLILFHPQFLDVKSWSKSFFSHFPWMIIMPVLMPRQLKASESQKSLKRLSSGISNEDKVHQNVSGTIGDWRTPKSTHNVSLNARQKRFLHYVSTSVKRIELKLVKTVIIILAPKAKPEQ